MIGEAKAGKKALPTGGAEVGKDCAVGACGSESVSGVSALLSRFVFPRLSWLLCGWFCAVCSKCLLCFCVDGEVFEGDFEIVFVAFLRPTYLPIALTELSVDELLWDAGVGHVGDVA